MTGVTPVSGKTLLQRENILKNLNPVSHTKLWGMSLENISRLANLASFSSSL